MLRECMAQHDTTTQTKRPDMPSEAGPLAGYAGQRPAAPDWFETAISARYETHFVERDGGKVHYQTWGDPAKPGILLTHGNGAHAHWWDFIAPYFSDDYFLVAVTLSGMGDSDWRSSYDMDGFTADQLAVAEASGLFADGAKPLMVSHSFGGFVTLNTIYKYGDKFDGVVIVDSPIHPPEHKHDGPPRRDRPNKVYPSLASALARFRLAPPQPCENHYAMDYIARHSLKETTGEGGQTGRVWKFDPSIWRRFEMADTKPSEMALAISCPLAFMRGEQSAVVEDEVWAYMKELLGARDAFITIPEAYHHIMLDQPLGFVSALQALLEGWRTV